MGTATDALEQLVRRIWDQPGPIEQVIGEWNGLEVGASVPVPGYGDHEPEVDYLFALYRKSRI